MKAKTKIADLLKATMGLDVATIGHSALNHGLQLRMAACHIRDEAAYWEALQDSPNELQALIEAVVVAETWFFRDRGAFAALAEMVLQEWAPAHRNQILRVLSLPCSTGEEPYSIAMALLDAGLQPSRFVIHGVDISTRALEIAERAVYGKNSFRGENLEFLERHFSRHSSLYELTSPSRRRVQFQHGNLLAPSFLAEVEPYDVVFCRNVLIYFDEPTQERVLQTLDRLVTANGLLFVGPAEPFLLRHKGFISTRHSHAFAYRKAPASVPAPAIRMDVPRQKPSPRRRLAGCVERQQMPKRLSIGTTNATPRAKNELLESASRLADAGLLAEAAEMCETHLRNVGPSAEGYYLLGVVCDAMRLERQAEECYRKTIYLAPEHCEALLHLALLAQKRGDLATAHRLQSRARRAQEGAVA